MDRKGRYGGRDGAITGEGKGVMLGVGGSGNGSERTYSQTWGIVCRLKTGGGMYLLKGYDSSGGGNRKSTILSTGEKGEGSLVARREG